MGTAEIPLGIRIEPVLDMMIGAALAAAICGGGGGGGGCKGCLLILVLIIKGCVRGTELTTDEVEVADTGMIVGITDMELLIVGVLVLTIGDPDLAAAIAAPIWTPMGKCGLVTNGAGVGSFLVGVALSSFKSTDSF